jgi:hypothetical protein
VGSSLGAGLWRRMQSYPPFARLTDALRERRSPRWHQIQDDYARCRGPLTQIARGLPGPGRRGTVLLVSTISMVWGWKTDGIVSLLLRARGFHPTIVEPRHSWWARRYHRLFGKPRCVCFAEFRARTGGDDPADFVLLPEPLVISRLMDLSYRGVDVGRIAVSNVLYRRKFQSFDLGDVQLQGELRHELKKVQRNVLAAERLLDSEKPLQAMLIEKGTSPSAEIAGVCMARGVPVIQFVSSQDTNGFVLKRFSRRNRFDHPFSLDRTTWERVQRLPWSSEHEAAVLEDFRQSYLSGTWFNRKFLHDGKRVKPPDEVRRQLGLDPRKKTVVVFSHVLWDATFFYGKNLFQDYETWLVETVRVARQNPAVNWVVKLHPDLVWKLKYENYSGELRDLVAIRNSGGSLPGHVAVVLPDTDISTFSFFEVTDVCVTVRGTIGIEMACHGIPVLTAGTGRYSNLGFTVDSATPGEYLARLARAQETPAMDPRQLEQARRFAYALFKLRPWRFMSFETVRLPLAQIGHPLDYNLAPRVRSAREFAAADDLRDLGEWIEGDAIDYMKVPRSLRSDMDNGGRPQPCGER